MKGLRCLDQQKRVNTIRDTWVKDIPPHDPAILQEVEVDYKFFYGSKIRPDGKPNQRTYAAVELRRPLADEVYLDCGDGYTSNSHKMKAICRWALKNGYDYVLRCDDDTFIYPEKILKTNFTRADYVGSGEGDFHPGGCLFLSRRAMEIIANAPITSYIDDWWMGQVLGKAGIPATHEPAMYNPGGQSYLVNPKTIPVKDFVSFHSCKPDVMRELYAQR
jgi:hypothetical protein